MSKEFPFPWKFERVRYHELYLSSRVTETRVQADILDLLWNYRVDAVAIDAGGRRQRGRMIAAGKASGLQLDGIAAAKTGGGIPAGFADLEATLAPQGRALYIEVKAPMWIEGKRTVRFEGKPSSAQLDFLSEKHRRGALVMLAWSADDVEQYLRGELDINWRALR